MLIDRLLTRACTIVTRSDSGDTDDYGNPIETETSTDTACELQQLQRAEPNDAGEFSDSTWAIFLPAGTTISTGDAVTVDETVYELVGAPWEVRHPITGRMTHIECTARLAG